MSDFAGPSEAPIHIDEVPTQEWAVGELDAKRVRLAAAAGAHQIGIAISEVAPGARLTPAHSHADEEEIFLVLSGSGFSIQEGPRRSWQKFAVAENDVIVHQAGGPAHTLIGGDEGMKVLILAEGTRSNITFLPRSQQYWLGTHWIPADGPRPFKGDEAAGPFEVPSETSERPASIGNGSEVPARAVRQGKFSSDVRDFGGPLGAHRLGLRQTTIQAGMKSAPRHWHSMIEEAFLVTSGSGTLVLGDEHHELREGSFVLRPPASGVPHQLVAGTEDLTVIGMSNRCPGDICVYPDSRKVQVRPGVWLPMLDVNYFHGEPDAQL